MKGDWKSLSQFFQVGQQRQGLRRQLVEARRENVGDLAFIDKHRHLRITDRQLRAILDFEIRHRVAPGEQVVALLRPVDDVDELFLDETMRAMAVSCDQALDCTEGGAPSIAHAGGADQPDADRERGEHDCRRSLAGRNVVVELRKGKACRQMGNICTAPAIPQAARSSSVCRCGDGIGDRHREPSSAPERLTAAATLPARMSVNSW